MGNNILKKLESSKGASLTFALLAFLVCAVISAVLLASASASAGRLSNLAESDQRYYAVTSAAQLFCDELDGQEFTIERVKKDTRTKVTRYSTSTNEAGEEVTVAYLETDNTASNYYITIKNAAAVIAAINDEVAASDTVTPIENARKKSLLTDAAISYVIGPGEGTNVILAYGRDPRSSDYDWSDKTWNISIAEGDPVLSVVATAVMTRNGTITIEFKNKETTETNPFRVLVTLTATDNTIPERTSGGNTVFSWSDDQLTETTETVFTKTTTVKWNVSSVQKLYGHASAESGSEDGIDMEEVGSGD